MSPSVEDFRNRLERLLTRCVPNLHLEREILNFDEKRAEFHANSHLVVILEFVVTHAVHETRLADRRVANHNQFEQVIVLGDTADSLRGNNLVVEVVVVRILDCGAVALHLGRQVLAALFLLPGLVSVRHLN